MNRYYNREAEVFERSLILCSSVLPFDSGVKQGIDVPTSRTDREMGAASGIKLELGGETNSKQYSSANSNRTSAFFHSLSFLHDYCLTVTI